MRRSDSTLKGLYLSAEPLSVGKDRTLSGFIMIIGAFTQGCANPGLQDGIPMGFKQVSNDLQARHCENRTGTDPEPVLNSFVLHPCCRNVRFLS